MPAPARGEDGHKGPTLYPPSTAAPKGMAERDSKVGSWPLSAVDASRRNVCFRRQSGHRRVGLLKRADYSNKLPDSARRCTIHDLLHGFFVDFTKSSGANWFFRSACCPGSLYRCYISTAGLCSSQSQACDRFPLQDFDNNSQTLRMRSVMNSLISTSRLHSIPRKQSGMFDHRSSFRKATIRAFRPGCL